jgi:hypothetical protein
MKRRFLVFASCVLSTSVWAGAIEAPRVSVFEKALNVILATALPKMSEALRETIVRDYENAKANKAQAVELASGSTWRSTGQEEQSVAGERALEGCQLRYGKPCALIAVNEEIAAEGQLIAKDMPRLQYSGEFDLAKIPVIRLETRLTSAVQGYSGAPGPKAVALHPWGRIFISQGKNTLRDTEDAALRDCNDDPVRKGRDGNCFLYAINDEVVISKRLQLSPSN